MQQLVGTNSKGSLGNIMSVLTNLGGNLNPEHPLVRQVQEKTGLQDQQQVTGYPEQAVSVIKQELQQILKELNHYSEMFLGVSEVLVEILGSK